MKSRYKIWRVCACGCCICGMVWLKQGRDEECVFRGTSLCKLLRDYLAWKYRTCLLVYLKSDLPVAYKALGLRQTRWLSAAKPWRNANQQRINIHGAEESHTNKFPVFFTRTWQHTIIPSDKASWNIDEKREIFQGPLKVLSCDTFEHKELWMKHSWMKECHLQGWRPLCSNSTYQLAQFTPVCWMTSVHVGFYLCFYLIQSNYMFFNKNHVNVINWLFNRGHGLLERNNISPSSPYDTSTGD